MFDQSQIDSFKSALEQANSFILALPPEPDIDLLASALALYSTLPQDKSTIQIGCSSPIKTDSLRLVGLDKIQTTIGSQNLVISLNFSEDKLEKIDYEKAPDGNIKLFIKPRLGEAAPDINAVKIGYAGASADLVIVFGIQTLEELGKLYADEKAFFDSANIVSFNLTTNPSTFAKLSFHTQSANSLAEVVAFLLKNIYPTISPDAASNLLLSLIDATNNFTSLKTTADTFELVAFLMRSGGKRPATIAPFSGHATVPADWKNPKVYHAKIGGSK
ncbi:MAG: hypothetical protein ACD_57C00360G0002 [uncultured bacterium]|nr:MAG: hypothetical protein ACD_57C00360G0002 [uncultured bacterium]